MIVYILRRLGATFIVMAVVALVVFSLLFLTPGDPAAVIAGDIATAEDIRNIRAKLGLDEPFLVQFGGWVWRLAHGDLGTSIFTNLPVTTLIGQRVQPCVYVNRADLVRSARENQTFQCFNSLICRQTIDWQSHDCNRMLETVFHLNFHSLLLSAAGISSGGNGRMVHGGHDLSRTQSALTYKVSGGSKSAVTLACRCCGPQEFTE